jgi:hypothetical protein
MEQTVLIYPDPISVERVSYLINQKGIDPVIANLDLEMVKMKLREPEEGENWTHEQCDSAEIEYKRYLHLCKKFGKGIVPNKIMDKFWHYHILETLPASLKDDTARMNDRIKHKQVTGQMNHQTADPKANASVFLFFPTAHFLKTILASRTNGTFAFAPTHKANPSAKAKEPFFANAQLKVISLY